MVDWRTAPCGVSQGLYITDGTGRNICLVFNKAHTPLIAAAPDMLEALKAMTKLYVDFVNSGDCGCWDPERIDEVKLARAAIAKAEGK